MLRVSVIKIFKKWNKKNLGKQWKTDRQTDNAFPIKQGQCELLWIVSGSLETRSKCHICGKVTVAQNPLFYKSIPHECGSIVLEEDPHCLQGGQISGHVLGCGDTPPRFITE